ncbi:hypothetical protein LPJ68_003045 [Coemansia sp. RSA 1086]|nr:hypothetical protein LPJ68_003045 [Coemansia sp. RSA 1086]
MSTAEQHPRKKLRSDLDKGDWSLTKVLGNSIDHLGFKHGTQQDRLLVDKTLLCKAFFDSEATVVCVSAPARFGKSVNIDIIEKFFDILTLGDLKDSTTYSYRTPSGPLVPEAARANRAKLFEQTLLREHHPEFFNKHFCRHPVIYTNFTVTQYDGAKPEYVYKRLLWNLSITAKQWLDVFDCKDLTAEQQERYKALKAMYGIVRADRSKNFNDWQSYKTSPKALFACLEDFVASISSERYIIIAEKCDEIFVEIQGKPWEQELRPVLLDLLVRMLKNNNQLLKALLVSTFAIPLDELDLDSTTSVIPAFNNCFHHSVDYPLTSEQAIASMFGFTSSEVCEIIRKVRLDDQNKHVLDCYGGYSFGYTEARFNPAQVLTYLSTVKRQQGNELGAVKNSTAQRYRNGLNLLRYYCFTPEDSVNSIVRKASPELLMLVLRLVSDYDHGTSSCFIWPSAEIMARQCKNAELSNFVLDPSANPGNTNADSSVDRIVTLLVLLGYLTIGNNNALRIPNSAMRDMWENLRLLATFKTRVQVEQDSQQHELIDSLFSSETDTICFEFTNTLQQISTDSRNYSPKTQLEFMCRVLLSKLEIMRYTFDHRPARLEYNAQFLADPQLDTPWTIKLLPFGRYIQQLTLTLCFRNTSAVLLPNEQAMAVDPSNEEPQHGIQLNLAVLIDNSNATVSAPN